ncbi:TetR family transcriptional regulator [Motilibacter rhizosphaerae]|uniref:TetR family transcriptional regulator n=1 Tax=Motilibacter rhizosphaerae TaxID=598652 RepID=A0A4Q7NRT4_9ACTN|nr:TetR family transcriptional regulator [Motilibacter rhizosphaerae]
MRNEQARQDILDAALALAAADLDGLTVDAIAARAGVGKQTIYRWWPSKWAVVLDALVERAATDVSPGTGTPERRLATFLATSFASLETSTGPVLRALMARAQFDAEFAEVFRGRLVEPRRAVLRELLAEGSGRRGADLDALVDMLFGAMWYRLLVGHGALDRAFARRLARLAVASSPPEPMG